MSTAELEQLLSFLEGLISVNTAGGGGGGVTNVIGDAPVTSTGGLTPHIGLATVNTSVGVPGVFGDATNVAQITVNAKGQVTAVENVAISGGGTQHAWLYDAGVPAAVVAPQLRQLQATVGAGQPLTVRSQAAATGSGAAGGEVNFIAGKDD